LDEYLTLDLLKNLFEKYPPGEQILSLTLGFYLDGKHSDIAKYLLEYKRVDPTSGKLVEITKEDLDELFGHLVGRETKFSDEELELIYNKLHDASKDSYTKLNFMLDQLSNELTQSNIDYMLREYPMKLSERDISVPSLVLFLRDAINSHHYRLVSEIYERAKHLLAQDDIEDLTQRARGEWAEIIEDEDVRLEEDTDLEIMLEILIADMDK